jgi:transglutaminase-like putative cysteine protease
MTSHRRTLAAALASAAASLSLYPIFIGTLWFWAGLGSIAVVAAVATATRLRPLPVPVCLIAVFAGLLLYLNLAFSNARSLYHLLPTPASIGQLFDLTGQGFDEASKYAPPVPELNGMVLLAAAGIGIAAVLTDLIAVRLASAALAGLPLLLLFTEPFTLSVGRGFFGTSVAFGVGVAGYLALLSSEGRDRIREWERPAASAAATDLPDTRILAAAGRRVGFASVVIALCLPLVVPGLHVTRLFGGQPGIGGRPGSGAGAGVGFPDPNTRLSQQLKTTQPSDVLAYTTKAANPDYLQIYVLDKLTDDGWQIFDQPESLVSVAPQLPAPPGLASAASALRVTTRLKISQGVGADVYGALPVPYPATTVSVPGTARADRTTLMVFDPGVALSGLGYSVTSLSQSPAQQQLNAAQPPPSAIKDRYLAVPPSYDSLYAVAERVISQAGAKTQFEEATALQNWLSGGDFKYTLNAPTVVNAGGLKRFLTDSKAGYCQQFSFAMAVLARLLGIPSRVAYGFTQGTSLGDNDWLVTTHDAHAWPQLYFQGFGWLRFEPTPSGGNGQGSASAPSYTLAPGSVSPGGTGQAAPASGPSTSADGGLSEAAKAKIIEALGGIVPANVGAGTGAAARGGGGGGATVNPWEVLGLVLAGLLAIVAVAPLSARLAIRRRRWRRADDAALAHAAWRELRDDLVDHSAGYRPSESPRAVAARAATGLALAEPAQAALGRIAMAEERARYAARPADGSGLRHDSATVRHAIAAAVPRWTRWRARLAPVSVLGPTLGAITAASDLYRGGRRTAPARVRASLLARYPRFAARGKARLQAALLPPAPALVEALHHRGARSLAPIGVARAAALARGYPRRVAKRDGGHLPPAVQCPDAREQQDDEPGDRQADHRQDDSGGYHTQAKSQPGQRQRYPTPVVHAGIARAD